MLILMSQHIKVIWRDLIRPLGRSRERPKEEASPGDGEQPRTGRAEKLNAMLPECTELGAAGRFKIKRAETGSQALLPEGCLDGITAAACRP